MGTSELEHIIPDLRVLRWLTIPFCAQVAGCYLERPMILSRTGVLERATVNLLGHSNQWRLFSRYYHQLSGGWCA